jgi:S-adenosylmethionine:tRNA ribosyltransferase-isomerase
VIAARHAVQRPADARLLFVDAHGHLDHLPRRDFVGLLRRGDLVVANDAATLPASLQGIHAATDSPIEVRLAGRRSLGIDDVECFTAIVFGAGDFRMRTEDRPAPPRLERGDWLEFGKLTAIVARVLGHPRLVSLRFNGGPGAFWEGLARQGRPVQYAYLQEPLELWDVWSPIAGLPVAFEPPSAGFVLDWQALAAMRAAGVAFATVTHAAGISSTGDEALDELLPFDEPYRIPESTAAAIRATRAAGARIVAIGTTVVRALEHAASRDGVVRAGDGVATQRVGADSRLLVVGAILSGTHEPGTSHYQLLRAFADDATLTRASDELERAGYRTHEFGDSVLIEARDAFEGRQRGAGVLRGV